mmetsp:Transcript_86179/g.241036  ORF Transcript_86179/g.241036 Transcript_86179/m.241036 type:complete len:211 (+) Transcript_86179:92-724(+)
MRPFFCVTTRRCRGPYSSSLSSTFFALSSSMAFSSMLPMVTSCSSSVPSDWASLSLSSELPSSSTSRSFSPMSSGAVLRTNSPLEARMDSWISLMLFSRVAIANCLSRQVHVSMKSGWAMSLALTSQSSTDASSPFSSAPLMASIPSNSEQETSTFARMRKACVIKRRLRLVSMSFFSSSALWLRSIPGWLKSNSSHMLISSLMCFRKAS